MSLDVKFKIQNRDLNLCCHARHMPIVLCTNPFIVFPLKSILILYCRWSKINITLVSYLLLINY